MIIQQEYMWWMPVDSQVSISDVSSTGIALNVHLDNLPPSTPPSPPLPLHPPPPPLPLSSPTLYLPSLVSLHTLLIHIPHVHKYYSYTHSHIHTFTHTPSPSGLPNPCSDNNGCCSHFCLLSPTESSGLTCAFPDGFHPNETGRYCGKYVHL